MSINPPEDGMMYKASSVQVDAREPFSDSGLDCFGEGVTSFWFVN